MEEYVNQFEELRKYVISVDGIHNESYYVDSFLSGLKEEISSALYFNKPLTLNQARDKERGQESWIEIMDKLSKNYGKTTSGYQAKKPPQ